MRPPKLKPTEFAINMYCSALALLKQEHLTDPSVDEVFEDQPPHIYFIVKRPRVQLIPESFQINHEFVEFDFKVQEKDEFKIQHFKTRNLLGSDNLDLVCEYPYSELKLVDKLNGKIVSQGFVYVLLNTISYHVLDPEFLDCEILYIGQAFGKDGNRTAIDRLQKHETLQLIYSEAIKKNPDSEIWICLASFDQVNITVMNGHLDFTEEELKQDEDTYLDTINTLNHDGMDEGQKINFTEAALIKYFQPQYNKEYKESFPTRDHKSYSECYDLDINSVGFEIDTSDKIKCNLYSQSTDRCHLHMISFLLHSPEERKAFFDFL